MANSFQYVDGWLAAETLRLLKNKIQTPQFFNTDYNKEFTKEFPVGDTVEVKFPMRFLSRRNTLGYSPQDLVRQTTTVKIDQVIGVDFEWDSFEGALKMERGEDEIRKEYIEPVAAQIAQDLESACNEYAYQNTPNVVGALGTNPTALTTFAAVRQRFVEMGAPMASGQKGMIIAPEVNTSMVDNLKTLFQADDELSRNYKEGTLGKFQGFRWFESPALYTHTAGTWSGAVTITSNIASGSSSIGVTCTSGDTFKKGDKISIASVYPVNPMTRRRVSSTTKQFTITADVTASSTSATLPIYPAIYGPGSPYQNVDALPVATAALTLWPGTTSPSGKAGKISLALHEDAFALVGVKLEMPKKGAEIAEQMRDPETGLSVRFIRQFDGYQSKMINRFDVAFGFGRLHAEAGSMAVAGA